MDKFKTKFIKINNILVIIFTIGNNISIITSKLKKTTIMNKIQKIMIDKFLQFMIINNFKFQIYYIYLKN
jgi:hypothetical protein